MADRSSPQGRAGSSPTALPGDVRHGAWTGFVRSAVVGVRGRPAPVVSRPRTAFADAREALSDVIRGGPEQPVSPRRPWRDLRLVPLAVALWAGSAWAVVGPVQGLSRVDTALWAWGLVLAALGGAGVFALRKPAMARRAAGHGAGRIGRKPAVGALAAAVVLSAAWGAGFAAGSARLERDTAGPVGELLAEGGPTLALVELLGEPRRHDAVESFGSSPRFIADARLMEATRDGLRFDASARVRIAGGAALARLTAGDRVRVAARAAGGTRDGTGFLVLSGTPEVLSAAQGVTGLSVAARESLRTHAAWLTGDSAGLVPALAAGDRSALDSGLEADLRSSGLGHLTAVSGANFAIILGCVLLVLRFARWPRWAVLVGCALALGAFVAVVGPEPSVLRAAAMGAVGLVALATGRAGASCSALCAAIVAVLLIDPSLALSYGFTLSVLATLGIAWLGPRLVAALARFLPMWLAGAVAVPLSAQLLCGPVLVLVDPTFHTWSIAANIVVAPLVPVITIASTAALAAGLLCPPLAIAAVALAGPAAGLLAAAAHAFARLGGATFNWPEGPGGAAMMAAFSLLNAGVILGAADPRFRASVLRALAWLAQRRGGLGGARHAWQGGRVMHRAREGRP
ncbi:ComEC/Rec2 family competence protein [Sinomonas sp. JGH33]|uniref:ComEC/Rec2 family competence protein n=1 Tax=Sinomonas terricola TaxID=3110330 RepID=A0ABU5T6Z8_9MICC|nr:ComEC/Rec2 family competence protein [Sinomonas sp. JGH33]MEA5455330.1 ComEC/Rec2 family competence protein [Sinomonas sp. JGH33]